MIDLQKGQVINLAKEAPSLREAMVMLSWVPKAAQITGADFDLDVSLLLLGENNSPFMDELDTTPGKNCESFIFYNNLIGGYGAIEHSGDDPTGAEGEQVLCKLNKLDAKYKKILVLVTIHNAKQLRQNFGMVDSGKVVLKDNVTGNEILVFDLSFEASIATGVQFCSLERKDNQWYFKADQTEFADGLAGFLASFGIMSK
jgi:tellurium resistance protein TerD